MRQEENNTFTKGLLQDLNPINTPNNVLTDNLNGTIITYDGNEYSLQNDRGNYPLQYCKLKPNYIPVGVKEYADTLYIVSYNPIDNTTEIGSYPSPLEISSSTDNNDAVTLPSLIQKSIETPEYTKLMESAQMQVFSDDELKLYPGDEYQIKIQDESKYLYEELEYYILDENRNKYNISDKIRENNFDFVPVGWTIPGWMAVQYRIAAFEDFQMNIRSFNVPVLAANSEGLLDLNFQLKISDNLMLRRLASEKRLDEIGLSIKICKNGSNNVIFNNDELFTNMNGDFVEWYESSKILWARKSFNLYNLNQGDTISVYVTPFIQITVDGKTYKVQYDNFTENISVMIANVGTYDDFNIATNTWKFWVEEDDDDHLYLEFDISGPIVTSNTINLYYKVSSMPNVISGVVDSTDYIKLESYNGVGHNMVLLDFDKHLFVKEGIYAIEFVFSENHPNAVASNAKKSVKKLVIASQIFADFVKTTPNFDKISFDEWVSKYKNTVKNADKWSISVESNNEYKKLYTKGDLVLGSGISGIDIPDHLSDFWKTNFLSSGKVTKYNHTAFITDDEWIETEGENTEFVQGYYTDANIKLTTELEVITGPMWDAMSRTASVKIKSHDELIKSFTPSINDLNNFGERSEIISPIVATKLSAEYKKISEGLVRGSTSNKNTSSTNAGIKFGVILGNNHRSGTNNYTTAYFKGVNSNLTNSVSLPTYCNEITEYGDKEKVPNGLSGAVSSFMTNNKLSYMVVFVIARPVKNDRRMYLKSANNTIFTTYDDEVTMQPFVVFKNKQGNPLFFPVDNFPYTTIEVGSTNSSSNVHYHEFPFNKWDGKVDFINRMRTIFGSFMSYAIYDITDGYFIKSELKSDDAYMLNIETEININAISEWYISGYNILNSTDRNALSSYLQNNMNTSCGNLLFGSTSELDEINIEGLQYDKYIDEKNISLSVKQSVSDLIEKIGIVNSAAEAQWIDWKTDNVFLEDSKYTNAQGFTVTNMDDPAVRSFLNSDFYKLIQSSYNGEILSLSSSGELLKFDVGGGNDSGPYCMGYIHTSTTFP